MTQHASSDRKSRTTRPSAPTHAREPRERQGKTTITDWSISLGASPLQLQALDDALTRFQDAVAVGNHEVYGDPLPGAVQLRRAADPRRGRAGASPQSVAARGVAGGGAPLPHAERLSAAFGRHDISSVRAHVGGDAAAASQELGARAYTSGQDIAFGSSPDLHLAAHEAAHVIQQRAGVSLAGGVGQAGDRYEQHADEVADAVVQGKSAEPILDRMAGGGATSAPSVQREPDPKAPLRPAPGARRRTRPPDVAGKALGELIGHKKSEQAASDAVTERFFAEPTAFAFWERIAKEAFRVTFENRLNLAMLVDFGGTAGADAAPPIPGLAVSANQAAKAEGVGNQAETFVRATFPDASSAGIMKPLITTDDRVELIGRCIAVAEKSLRADIRYGYDDIFTRETDGLAVNVAVYSAFEVYSNREISHYTATYEAWRQRAGDDAPVDLNEAVRKRYEGMPSATVDLPTPTREPAGDDDAEAGPEETVEQAPIQRKESGAAPIQHDELEATHGSEATGETRATEPRTSAGRVSSHAPATSTYDGNEMGPNEDDAEFLAEVADALDAEAARRGAARDPMQRNIADALRAEAAKVRVALSGKGDWRRYIETAPWTSRDVRWCIDDLVMTSFAPAFEARGQQIEREIVDTCSQLEEHYAVLVRLRESVREAQDVFEDVADYLELIGYVERIKSISDWVGLAATRGQSTPNPYDESSLFLTGTTGGTGASLARDLASSKLVTQMGEHGAVLSCFRAGGDADCMELARGLDGTLRAIAKLSEDIEAKFAKLVEMQRVGLCAVTNDPLAGCQ